MESIREYTIISMIGVVRPLRFSLFKRPVVLPGLRAFLFGNSVKALLIALLLSGCASHKHDSATDMLDHSEAARKAEAKAYARPGVTITCSNDGRTLIYPNGTTKLKSDIDCLCRGKRNCRWNVYK